MAVDEALLAAAGEQGVATLRFYQWSAPTLSLGYFQPYEGRQLHAASHNCPCVRRHSGGGAILHDRELTYSLSLPVGQLPAGGTQSLYDAAHLTLVGALVKLLPAAAEDRLQLSSGITRPAATEPFMCFERRSPGDVVVTRSSGTDAKIAGSAQRKRRGAVLQHGSVLVSQSTAAPELPGLADLLGCSLPCEDLIDCWYPELLRKLSLHVAEPADKCDDYQRRQEKFQQQFASDDWSHRR